MSQSNNFDDNSAGDKGLLSQVVKFFGRSHAESDGPDPNAAHEIEPVTPLNVPKRGKIFKYIIYATVVAGLLGVIFFIYIPQQQQKNIQQNRLTEVGNQSAELQRLKLELLNEKKLLALSKENFESLKARAYSQKELDRLFGNISYLAQEYELLIDRIEQQTRQSNMPELESKIEFSEIQINLNVSGKYLNYLTFRRALFGANKAIDMPSEKIRVLPNSNSIQVIGVLRVYLFAEEEGL